MPTFPVNEVYATILGEGSFAGVAAICVRLQGCAIHCQYCNVKHTWALDEGAQISARELEAKRGAKSTYSTVSIPELVGIIRRRIAGRALKHVLITGGEPAAYELLPLLLALRREGWAVSIETSGAYPVPMRLDYFLTLSPRFDMPYGHKVLPTVWVRADEIRLAVGSPADIDRFLAEADPWLPFEEKRIYLQPFDHSEGAVAVCVEQAKARGWAMVLPHSLAGVVPWH